MTDQQPETEHPPGSPMKQATEIYVGNAVSAITFETDAAGASVTVNAGVAQATFRISERELRRLTRTLRSAVESIEAAQASSDDAPVKVELPPVRVQGFDRMFTRLGEILGGQPAPPPVEDAPRCETCHGKGWLTPDDVGDAIESSSELYGAGYDLGKKMAEDAPSLAPAWQPIETAPRQYQPPILILVDGVVWQAQWDRGWRSGWQGFGGRITHWMPLPAAPVERKDR